MARNINGIMAVLGCSVAIFWPGALTFGFPGVMAPIWQGRNGTRWMIALGVILNALGVIFGAIFRLAFAAYGFVAGPLGPALSGLILYATDNNFFWSSSTSA